MAFLVKNKTAWKLLLIKRSTILQAAMPMFLLLGAISPHSALRAQEQNDSLSVEEQKRPIADSHSFMELFTKLEDQWSQAVKNKDRPGIDALLAPEFVVRNTKDPEHPAARDTWISETLAGPEVWSFSHSAMSIRAFMGVAIVSFMQREQQKAKGKVRTVRCFIVDVWEVNHNRWFAAERYISPEDSGPLLGVPLEDQRR